MKQINYPEIKLAMKLHNNSTTLFNIIKRKAEAASKDICSTQNTYFNDSSALDQYSTPARPIELIKQNTESTQTTSLICQNQCIPMKNSFQNNYQPAKKLTDAKASFPTKPDSKLKTSKTEISQECLSLITKIQQGSKPDYKSKLLDIPIPNVSQRERYEEFSKEQIEFVLPVTAKHLIQIVQSVDQYLFLTKSRGGSTFFQNISQSLMTTQRLTFQLTDLMKIIKISHDIYDLKWMVNEKMQNKDKYDLCINLPDSNSISNRRESFKAKILQVVREKHTQFLQNNNLQWNIGENSQLCLWHEDFQVHSIEFENGELPEKPKEIKALSTTPKNNLNLLTVKFDQSTKLQPDISRSRLQGEANGCLGDKILQKIKRKEKQIQYSAARTCEVGSEFLTKISSILFHHYKSRSTNTMFLVQVVDFLIRQNGLFSGSQYRQLLITMCQNTTGFSICTVNDDEIIKLNGNMNLFEIQQEIKQNKLDS